MLAQVLHQVYGGGILAVIMHHTTKVAQVKILSQFLYRPSFGSSFFVLAQVLHQVYGGGILAVIMHHSHLLLMKKIALQISCFLRWKIYSNGL